MPDDFTLQEGGSSDSEIQAATPAQADAQPRTPDPRMGFDIGWDYACHGLLLPTQIHEQHPEIVSGFYAARERGIKPKPQDRFVRKWLLLRTNAWRRCRQFDASVTVDFLREIDVTHCPITGVKLTHGTGEKSDWSIDRINNDAAYAAGNLVVVSAHANMAKANFNFDQMVDFAYDESIPLPVDTAGNPPLSREQWGRWAYIASHNIHRQNLEDCIVTSFTMCPAIIYPPPGVSMNLSTILQIAIAHKAWAGDEPVFTMAQQALPKSLRKDLNHLVTRAERLISRGSAPMPLDVWRNTRIFNELIEMYDRIPQEHRQKLFEAALKKCAVKFGTEQPDWSMETKGYTPTPRKPSM